MYAIRSYYDYAWRRDGERHQWNPYTIGRLQQAARHADREAYGDFAAAVNDQSTQLQTVRGLLDFATDVSPVPLEEVEPVEAILRRFATGSRITSYNVCYTKLLRITPRIKDKSSIY